MKRQIFILLFFIAYSICTNAQNYYTLPDSNVTWITQQDDGFGGFHYWELSADSINKDTIINSKTYTKISTGIYQGAYRSDTLGLAYIVPHDSLQEFLIMDLTKNSGDTIKNVLVYSNTFPSGSLVKLHVDSVNYIQDGPYSLKRLFLSNHLLFPQNYSYIFWIEKIGTSNGIYNDIHEIGLGSSWVCCMQHNDTIFYDYMTSDQFVYEKGHCINPTSINNCFSNPEPKVFPNPTTDKIIVEQISQNTVLTVYDISGRLLLQNSFRQSKSEIDLSSLSKGVYILKLNNNDHIFVTKIIKE
jgi:hypothetical protein